MLARLLILCGLILVTAAMGCAAEETHEASGEGTEGTPRLERVRERGSLVCAYRQRHARLRLH